MRKDVKIGDKTIAMTCNAASPVIYRQVFKQDLLVFLQGMIKARTKTNELPDGTGEMFSRLAYIMAMQAEKTTAECFRELSVDGWLEWLTEFAPLEIEQAGPDIMNLYYATESTTSKAKN